MTRLYRRLKKAAALIDSAQVGGYLLCFGCPGCAAAQRGMYGLAAGGMLVGAVIVLLINLERVREDDR